MMTRILAKGYLWLLLALLYSPILIIMVFSFTEAKVLGNWTGFSTKLYSSLFTGGMHHSLTSAIWNTFAIAMLAATASTALGSIAAIGSFAVMMFIMMLDNVASLIPTSLSFLATLLTKISFMTRYSDFVSGILNFANVLFFLSVAVVFNFLTVRVLEKKRWS